MKCLAKVKLRDPVLLDNGNASVDLRQAYADGIFEIYKNYLILIGGENKLTKSNIYIPISNVVSFQIIQELEGAMKDILEE